MYLPGIPTRLRRSPVLSSRPACALLSIASLVALLLTPTPAAPSSHHRPPVQPVQVQISDDLLAHLPILRRATPTPRAKAATPASTPRTQPAAHTAPARPPQRTGAVSLRVRSIPRVSRALTRPALVTTASAARSVARSQLSSGQYACLSAVITRESGWNLHAYNPASGAYGLPQAVPGSKMASAGADWRSNAATQIAWGISYMNSRYGSPCGAWNFWQKNGWY